MVLILIWPDSDEVEDKDVEDADFDLCEECLKWVLYNLKHEKDFGIPSLKELSSSGVNLDGLSAGTKSVFIQLDVAKKVE